MREVHLMIFSLKTNLFKLKKIQFKRNKVETFDSEKINVKAVYINF